MVQLSKPKYVHRTMRKNKRGDEREYWYSCPPGMARKLIPHPVGTDQFNRFADARNAQSARNINTRLPGTFKDLADTYRGVPVFGVTPSKSQRKTDPLRYGPGPATVQPSQQWIDLEERTRKDYTRFVDRILEMWRGDLVSDLEVEMVVEVREARRSTPRMANHLLNVLSAMLSVALERKRQFGIGVNVAANVDRLGMKDGVKPREQHWTYEDENRFLADADQTDPVIALGERLLAYTGQRPSEVRQMELSDYDGEKIRVLRRSTGDHFWLKCHKDLKPHLDKAVADAQSQGISTGKFLRGIRGGPIDERYFNRRWSLIAKRTGTSHLNRQDLRRTVVRRLFEAGCTPAHVASVTGLGFQQIDSIYRNCFGRDYEVDVGPARQSEQAE